MKDNRLKNARMNYIVGRRPNVGENNYANIIKGRR